MGVEMLLDITTHHILYKNVGGGKAQLGINACVCEEDRSGRGR